MAKKKKEPDWTAIESVARAGDGASALQAGERYICGRGVDVDERKAMEFFELGYAAGDITSRAWIGYILLNAETMERDEEAGLRHIEAGAAAGVDFAVGTLEARERKRKEAEFQTKIAGMDEQERLRFVFAEHGAEGLTALFLSSAKPSVRLVAEAAEDANFAPWSSKLGGAPDVPAGFEWPAAEGAPMRFVGQINLWEAGPMDETLTLPRDGLLLFFISSDYETGRVIHLEEGAELERWTGDPAPAYKACSLSMFNELTLPFIRTMEVDDWSLDEEPRGKYWDAYCKYQSEMRREPRRDGKVHRMLGHANAIQGDMRRQIECSLAGKEWGEEDEALIAAARKWVLLLQVDSERNAGMMWFDLGRIFYWIREEDLAAKRLDRVEVMLQY